MLSPFSSQLMAIIISVIISVSVGLSAWLAVRRFHWTWMIAAIYGAAILGIYISLSYLLQENMVRRIPINLIPAAIVLVGVGFTMMLSEYFWRQYNTVQAQLARTQTRLIEAMERELQMAHDVQVGLLPRTDPSVPGFEITGRSLPANHVGGDHYAYFWLDEEKTKFAIVIADVSGHEMKAAMMVMRFSEILRYEIQGRRSPKEILIGLNHSMCRRLERRMFITVCIGVLDLVEHSFEVSNAGHPLVYHRSGTDGMVKEVGAYGFPLGVSSDAEYQEVNVPLMSGDTLVFYTDGIYEAQNGEGKMYGFEGLEERIRESGREASAVETLDHILRDVKGFIGESLQGDDMTLVVVKTE